MPDIVDGGENECLLVQGPPYGSISAPTSVLEEDPSDSNVTSGESFDNVPQARRHLSLATAAFLVFNSVIGTGIFATPSVILHSSGSIGIALLMWVLGALIAIAGTTVYVELGTGLPRSGGEKNYLEYMYRRPKFMVSCAYAVYTLIARSNAPNSVVFGEYMIHALALPPTAFNTRFTALLCLTFSTVMIGVFSRWGLHLLNTLGTFKFGLLAGISAVGLLSLAGAPGLAVRPEYENPNNFEWHVFWAGSKSDPNSLAMALYNVIWSFVGYSEANYILSEVRNPVRTIKRAAPLAILLATVVYIFVNLAYLSVVSKNDILGSRQIIAALFFRNLFGPATERALSACIALSSLGAILSFHFSYSRVIQEIGREGIVTFSAFLATSKPFGTPLAGLSLMYFLDVVKIIAVPPGDAYLFLISLVAYSSTLINTLISLGLLLLYTSGYRPWGWAPPFRAPRAVVAFYFVSNVFLSIMPLIPPAPGSRTFQYIPYYMHVLVTLALSQVGIVYWYVSFVWLPKRNGYAFKREWMVQDDGVSRYVFARVPILQPPNSI